MNENTDITSKTLSTAETHFSTNFALDNKVAVVIQNKHVSNPYTKDILISNIFVDDNARSFETPRKIITVSLHQANIFIWVVTMISSL